MAPGLRFDRRDHIGMPMAERRHANSGNQIEVAAAVGRDQPASFGLRNFERDRRVRSLRQPLQKEIAQIAHRAPTIASRKMPPPCAQSSGGDCIAPARATYEIPISEARARNSSASF